METPGHYQHSRSTPFETFLNHYGADATIAACRFNVWKYLDRFQHKGAPIEDLKKARHYIDLLIQITEADHDPET